MGSGWVRLGQSGSWLGQGGSGWVSAGQLWGSMKIKINSPGNRPPIKKGASEQNPYFSIAVQNNDCRLITTLIEDGAQIEATTEEGATPLLLAADMEHIEAAETLLNKGAQLIHKDKEGWQAIHWAHRNETLD